MKIGILGGTFNPVHLGHLIMAQTVAKKFKLEQVLFIPCAVPYHKKNIRLANARHRLKMVRLAVGSGVEVRSLPFWQARPGSVPLGAVFILEHGAVNRRTPMAVSEAIQELRRHIYWPVEHPTLMRKLFETLADVCRNIPIYRLAFRPEPSVWTTMTEGL